MTDHSHAPVLWIEAQQSVVASAPASSHSQSQAGTCVSRPHVRKLATPALHLGRFPELARPIREAEANVVWAHAMANEHHQFVSQKNA